MALSANDASLNNLDKMHLIMYFNKYGLGRGMIQFTKNDPPFQDRFSAGHSVPSIDPSQDWKLLWASENETHTTFIVNRFRKLCDDQDLDITVRRFTVPIS